MEGLLDSLKDKKKDERRASGTGGSRLEGMSAMAKWKVGKAGVSAMGAFEEPIKEKKDRLELEKKMSTMGDRSKPFIIIQRLRMAMQTPPEERTEAQLMSIMTLCAVGCKVYGEQSVKVLRKLCTRVRLEAYKKGQVIFKENEEGTDWAAVLFGTVAIIEVSKNGFRKKIGTVQKGFAFGDKSLISGEKRFAACVAETTCEILLVDKETYLRAFQNPIPDITAFLTCHVKPMGEFSEDDPDIIEFANTVMLGKLPRGEVLEVDYIDGLYIFTRGQGALYLGPQTEAEIKQLLEQRGGLDAELIDEEEEDLKAQAKERELKANKGKPIPVPTRNEINSENFRYVLPACKELSKVVPGDFIGESLGMNETDWREYPRGLLVHAMEPLDFYKIPINLYDKVHRQIKTNFTSEGKFKMSYYVGRQGGYGTKRVASVEEATLYGGDRNKTFYENAQEKYPGPCNLFPEAIARKRLEDSLHSSRKKREPREKGPYDAEGDPLYVPYRVHKWRVAHPDLPPEQAPWKEEKEDEKPPEPPKPKKVETSVFDRVPDEITYYLPPIFGGQAENPEDAEELKPLNMDPPVLRAEVNRRLSTKKNLQETAMAVNGKFKRRSVTGTID